MKLFLTLAATVALYGGTELFHDEGQDVADASRSSGADGVYRLVADGTESCTVTRAAVRSGGFFTLVVDPGCDTLLPGIARAKRWREGGDGTVILSRDDGEKIVAFSVADGDGYLSYAPATPLLSLTKQ